MSKISKKGNNSKNIFFSLKFHQSLLSSPPFSGHKFQVSSFNTFEISRLPNDRILNRRLIKQNNSIDIRFGIGGREKFLQTLYFLTFLFKIKFLGDLNEKKENVMQFPNHIYVRSPFLGHKSYA